MEAPQTTRPRNTFSVCPVCLNRIPAVLEQSGGDTYLRKICPVHGAFSAVIWRGEPLRRNWIGTVPEIGPDENTHCPTACGLCPDHRQDTCCVLLEVTSRCNLSCSFCFADAGDGMPGPLADPSLADIQAWIKDISSRGKTFLQLSGGEPTLRDDLPRIVRIAREAGCEYVQLNSNGLRLARDDIFVKALAEAGLSFVFMQFDGTKDAIYERLRGKALFAQKCAAIENCGRHNLGVTLVPTLVPGVNNQAVGDILRFAVKHSPLVRGVHFQPVSYFGRFPKAPGDDERLTLPEVYQAVFSQAGDLVPENSISPSHCDHAACGFHGAYIVTPEGLHALGPQNPSSCRDSSPAERNRRFVGRRWLRPVADSLTECRSPQQESCCCDLKTLDGFLSRSRTHSFTISAMAFQDAYTLDLERLRQCSLHVYSQGRIVPFCSHYLTGGSV